MPEKVVRLRPDGGPVTVEVAASAPSGICTLRLWDEEGRNPRPIGTCTIPTGTPEPLGLGAVQELGGRMLTWRFRLDPVDRSARQRYQTRIRILQGGEVAPGGEFYDSGPLDEFEERGDRFLFGVA